MKILISLKKSVPTKTAWYWKGAAKAVQIGTRSEYFHVEIAIDNKWIAANTDKGVILTDLKTPVYNTNYDYFEFEVPDLTDHQKEILWRYINSQVHSGYDWLGIYLTQVIKLDWESKSKWFCSEFVVKMLQLLYVEEFLDLKPNRISPQMIYNIIKPFAKKIEVE